MEWNRSMAVGVKLIDEQHQELIRRLNALLDAMGKQQGKPEVEKLLAFLATYVLEHFGAEERLMAQYRYPQAVAHKQQHADFIRSFKAAKAEFDKVGPTSTVTISLNRMVCSWLREHIATTDTSLGKYLQTVTAPQARV